MLRCVIENAVDQIPVALGEFREGGPARFIRRHGIIFQPLTVREMMKRNFVPDASVRLNAGDVVVGVLSRKLPNGDVELETQAGIFRTLKADEILSTEPIIPTEKK